MYYFHWLSCFVNTALTTHMGFSDGTLMTISSPYDLRACVPGKLTQIIQSYCIIDKMDNYIISLDV